MSIVLQLLLWKMVVCGMTTPAMLASQRSAENRPRSQRTKWTSLRTTLKLENSSEYLLMKTLKSLGIKPEIFAGSMKVI
jgi:hypothetical protein